MLPSLAMKISTTTVRKVMIKEVLSSGARDQAGALTSGAEQASQGIIWHQSPFTMAYVTMSYVTYHNGTMSYVSYVICHHVTRVDFATHLGNWLCHKHCVVTRKMAHMSQPARLQCHTKNHLQYPISPLKVLQYIGGGPTCPISSTSASSLSVWTVSIPTTMMLMWMPVR